MVKKRYSLVFRLALPFAGLLVFTMGALSLYLSAFIQNSYLNLLRGSLQSETRLVADRMALLMQTGADQAALSDRANRYADLLNVRVTVIDPQGKVLADSSTNPQDMENHANRPEIQSALQNTPSTELRFSNTLQMDMLYAAAPIQDNNHIIGVARLAISLNNIQRNEGDLMRSVLFATFIATGLALILAILIAAYTVLPIKRLTETAQQVADGKISEIISTNRKDEVGQLQQSIQFMAQRLNQQIEELRTERGKLEAVLGNMTDGVIIVDAEGMVQMINPASAQLFNTTEPDALHKSLAEVVRHHQLVEIWQTCLATGEQQTATLETAPDRLFVQGIATPLDESLPGMTLLVLQDLTRVRRLETVRRDFVSNVSHELRTPLASLKALTETLQEGALEDPPAARRFLQRMDTEIDNLTQMVHELLELSRIESNKVPLKRIPVDPCKVVTPAIERMQLQAERAGLNLFMDCPNNLPLVRADASRIEQVLVNLIHNAIKFTQPGGQIRVSLQQDRNMIVIAIQDSGVGIAPDILPRIFERFYKVDRSRSGGGTGLGLSIARHIIEAHGGQIWAESTQNVGSTFFFTLPIA